MLTAAILSNLRMDLGELEPGIGANLHSLIAKEEAMHWTKERLLDREFPGWREAFETLTLSEWIDACSAGEFAGLMALNSASWVLSREKLREMRGRPATQAEIAAERAK